MRKSWSSGPRLWLLSIGLLACGGGESTPTERSLEIQVVDDRGTPQADVYVAAYDSDYAPFFFEPDVTAQTDSRGIAQLQLPTTGTYWFEAVDASRTPALSSLSSGATLIARDLEEVAFFQIVVRPFVSGQTNLPGTWRYSSLDEGPETMTFGADLKYELRWREGEAETGQCIFKELGWVQGHLTCAPSDGFLEREYFVNALTNRYLGLTFAGAMMLYEKQGVADPNVTPPQSMAGSAGSGSVAPTMPPLGSGGTPNGASGPGAPASVELTCSTPSDGFGRSCASDRDCGCEATVCLPVLHYCSKLDCSGAGDCPTAWSCSQLGSAPAGARSLCLKAEAGTLD